jgi:ABC-type nitrate/sulfonate/bicarbonate transport system permease component
MQDVNTASAQGAGKPAHDTRWRVAARTALPFIVVGALWEVVARLQVFPPRLFPPLEVVAAAFVRLTASGALHHHVFDTLLRLLAGFALAAAVGVTSSSLLLSR